MVNYIKNLADFDVLVSKETKLIVVDFTATWYVRCNVSLRYDVVFH